MDFWAIHWPVDQRVQRKTHAATNYSLEPELLEERVYNRILLYNYPDQVAM